MNIDDAIRIIKIGLTCKDTTLWEYKVEILTLIDYVELIDE
jgi:hypothetical protein